MEHKNTGQAEQLVPLNPFHGFVSLLYSNPCRSDEGPVSEAFLSAA
jgi:hypothetical protein